MENGNRTADQIAILDRPVTVCEACVTASCWLHIFLCEDYRDAGTKELTVRELRELNRENPDYWFRDPNTGTVDHNAAALVEELMPT